MEAARSSNPNIIITSLGNIHEGHTYGANCLISGSTSTSWTGTIDYGDGTPAEKIKISGTALTLKHVYKDNGNFTVVVSLVDDHGISVIGKALAVVHNVSAKVGEIIARMEPVASNTPLSIHASFSDAGIFDTHTATWNWGDEITTEGKIIESNGSGYIQDDHMYTKAGVYAIKLTVSDKDGGITLLVHEYIAAYNPDDENIFAASRMFASPQGAYTANPQLTGQVTFGVSVSMIPNNPPKGDVFLHFAGADMLFSGTEYTSLEIADGKATIKGKGKINGNGNYSFILEGIDNSRVGKEDCLRIQIKDESGKIYYDNQPEMEETAGLFVPIKGQIIIRGN